MQEIVFSKDENNNIIYGDLSKQRNCNIKFDGKNNIVFFAGSSVNVNVEISGDNALLFMGDGGWTNGKIYLRQGGLCYIGNRSTFNGTTFRVLEAKNIIVGDDNMFSWGIWLSTCDHHLIFDIHSHKRSNFSKSIYIGDHCWVAQESAILKGVFMASGSILGAKAVASKGLFSNAIYAGNPSKCVKKGKFWDRKDPVAENFTAKHTKEFEYFEKDDFIFSFEKERFLDPNLIEKELQKCEKASQKLEFVYDYIYNNTHKNRFALYETSDKSECKLYKDESKKAFRSLNFTKLQKPEEQKFEASQGAVSRVKNTLSYQLGRAMIENYTFLGVFKLPFILLSLQKEFKKQRMNAEKLPPLETYADFGEALKVKEHLSYKLGSALIQCLKEASNNPAKFIATGGGGSSNSSFASCLR